MPASAADGDAAAALAAARRLVVKVGSAIVVDEAQVAAVAAGLAGLRAGGVEACLVTSGAIALGKRRLGLAGPLKLAESQAASAAGQAQLIDLWQNALAPHGMTAAQLLLTRSDAEHRRRYLNARATIATLIELGATPVVNENDTVATAEIRYGDNDRLAAHAAQLAGAEVLLLLSDVDGFYDADPRDDPAATRFDVVERVTPEIEALAAGPNATAGVGVGGMATKIAAAKIAAAAGCATIVASGRAPRPIETVREGGPATLFRAPTTPQRARKIWILNHLRPTGRLVVDDGAAAAIAGGASLLPSGVTRVEGAFDEGDVVDIAGASGDVIAKGVAQLDAAAARLAAGRRSAEVEALLGPRRRPAIVDRDDLARVEG